MSSQQQQRELESRIKALHKAQAEKAPAASIISLLEGLKKDVRPTEDMLRVCNFFDYISSIHMILCHGSKYFAPT